MRTTLTLDEDNAEQLRELSHRSKLPFKRVLNEALRRGLSSEKVVQHEAPYRVQAKPMGLKAGIDPMRLSKFESDLDIDAFRQKTRSLKKSVE